MMKNWIVYFSLAVSAHFTLVACDSKFVESSPNSVKIEGLSLDERLSNKAKVDQRISQIEKGAEKVKRIIEMFRKIQDPKQNQDIYTPIDFVIDLNTELKAKIPESRDGRLIRSGKIELPIEGLSEECRVLHTTLESSVIYDDTLEIADEKKAIGERLTYSFKSCASDEIYLVAVEADWIGSSLEFHLNKKNLEIVFNDILVTELLKDSACKITQGDKEIIESIYCENLNVKLTNSEDAIVKKMLFSNTGDIRFEALADIFENLKKKATSDIKVFANGEVKVNLNKVETVQ